MRRRLLSRPLYSVFWEAACDIVINGAILTWDNLMNNGWKGPGFVLYVWQMMNLSIISFSYVLLAFIYEDTWCICWNLTFRNFHLFLTFFGVLGDKVPSIKGKECFGIYRLWLLSGELGGNIRIEFLTIWPAITIKLFVFIVPSFLIGVISFQVGWGRRWGGWWINLRLSRFLVTSRRTCWTGGMISTLISCERCRRMTLILVAPGYLVAFCRMCQYFASGAPISLMFLFNFFSWSF